MIAREPVCRDCGAEVAVAEGYLVLERNPCEQCGSRERTYPSLARTFSTEDDVGLVLRVKSHKRKRRKPLLEGKSGATFSVSLKRWVWRSIDIDREHDKYVEIVIDPQTGTVLRHCSESLKEHRSRGSAKLKSDNNVADA